MISANLKLKRGRINLEADLVIENETFVGLTGRTGSGKSSLLRCLAGLTRARGKVSVKGSVWQDDSMNVFVPTHLRQVAYMNQFPYFFPFLNVEKNIQMGERKDERRDALDKEFFEELLLHFDLRRLVRESPTHLSGGEQKRVALARALYSRPKLLLLDEPLSGLDPESKAELLPYLQKIRSVSGVPGIYVSHDSAEFAGLCTQVYRMDNGVLRA